MCSLPASSFIITSHTEVGMSVLLPFRWVSDLITEQRTEPLTSANTLNKPLAALLQFAVMFEESCVKKGMFEFLNLFFYSRLTCLFHCLSSA